MIIRRIFFAFVLLVGVACACAQELTVEGMELSGSDLSASTERRVDNKGKNCALVKVQLAAPDVQFEGNIIEPVKFKEGEYWVYMSEGSSQLTIKQPDYPSLAVNFVDYAIDGVRSLTTYVLTINVPSDGTVDDGKRFLSLFVEQAGGSGPLFEEDEVLARRFIELFDVKVYVDDLLQELHNGRVTILLSRGKHTYRVEHEGYITVMDTIDIAGDNIYRDVRLKSSKMDVTLFCPIPDAEIYIDGKDHGVSPWITNLNIGTMQVEVRHEGYRSWKQELVLSENDNGQVFIFPALEPLEAKTHTADEKMSQSPDDSTPIQRFTVNGVSFNMIRVDGGTFMMGATKEKGKPYNDAKPAHQVSLSSYYIGETEVTQALWEAVMNNNPSEFKGANRPVEMVSWYDCLIFIQKLNEATGQQFRLPTEAEWEYAARGGSKSRKYKYSGSNNIEDVAWYRGNCNYQTHDVKTRKANTLGIYDMTGNVDEWCYDLYGSYNNESQINPKGALSGLKRVYRGGSWCAGSDYSHLAIRESTDPTNNTRGKGFRLAR